MKIGINASFLRKPGTGIGQVTTNFLKQLVQQYQSSFPVGLEFFLYCEEMPHLDFVLPENVHVKVFLPWWRRDDLPRKWLWEKQLSTEAGKDGCEVFLSLYQSSTIFHAASISKHVMVVHDIIPKFFPEYRRNMRQSFYWRAVERGIQMADQVVTVSEYTKADLVRELALRREKISLAYPDVAPRFYGVVSDEQLASVLEKYDIQPGYIYHGGGLEVRKNAARVLQAYKKLVTDVEQQSGIPQLVISGKIFHSSNKLATDVEGLVEALGLEDRVKLLGFVSDEDIPALYRGALFFVYPSLYEGFGLPVLEALHMRVPVLTSNVASLPEVAADAALYCDPKNTQSIADGMRRLMTDSVLREALVSVGEKQASKFNWEQFVKKILDTLL